MARTLASLVVVISAKTAELVTGIQKSKKELDGLKKSAAKAVESIKGTFRDTASSLASIRTFVVAIAVAMATGRVAQMFKQTADEIERVGRTAKRLGLATEDVSALRYAALQSGVEFETLSVMMSKAAKNLGKLKEEGSGSLSLGKIVIPLRSANGELRSMAELFPDIVKAISQAGSQGEKLALAEKVFGREGGAQFVDWLADSGDLLRDLTDKLDRAKRLGVIFTPEQAANAKAFGDAVTDVKEASLGLRTILVDTLSPWLTKFLNGLAMVTATVKDSIRSIVNAFRGGLREMAPVLKVGDLIDAAFALAVKATQAGMFLVAVALRSGLIAAIDYLRPVLFQKVMSLLADLWQYLSDSMRDEFVFGALNPLADAFQGLSNAFRGLELMDRGAEFANLQTRVLGAADAGSELSEAWKAMGIILGPYLDRLKGKAEALFVAMNKVKVPELGPKNGAQTPPFLQGVRDGLTEIIKRAEDLNALGKNLTTTFVDGFGDRLSDGLSRGEISIRNFGRAVTKILGDVSQQLIKIALNAALTRAVAGIGDYFTKPGQSAVQGPPDLRQEHGGAWLNGKIQAYGDGGVTDRPTYFATAMGRLGLMGEKNQPEGIFPLKRMPSGDLGVQASGSTSVQIIDQRGSQAPPAEVRRQPAAGGGENVTVIIRDAVKSAIGNGSLDRVLGLRYGLTPAGR